jgi:hypothetical protein
MTVTIVMHTAAGVVGSGVLCWVPAEAISGEPKLTKSQLRREWFGVCRPSGSK